MRLSVAFADGKNQAFLLGSDSLTAFFPSPLFLDFSLCLQAAASLAMRGSPWEQQLSSLEVLSRRRDGGVFGDVE